METFPLNNQDTRYVIKLDTFRDRCVHYLQAMIDPSHGISADTCRVSSSFCIRPGGV